MRHYESDVLCAINEHTQTIRVGAADVLVKPSPSEPRPGYVDRVLWEEIKDCLWADGDREARNAGRDPLSVVLEMRATAGSFNENINSVEIYTKYEELPAGENTVGLWRYFPRRSMNRADHPALIFFHGGGWVGGTVYAVENACRYLAEKADAVVFSVDY